MSARPGGRVAAAIGGTALLLTLAAPGTGRTAPDGTAAAPAVAPSGAAGSAPQPLSVAPATGAEPPHPAIGTRASIVLPANRIKSFQHMAEYFPTRTISRGGQVREIERAPRPVEKTPYVYDGKRYTIEEFLVRDGVTGMVVLKDGRLVYEVYREDADASTRFTSHSAAKSFTGVLVALAVAEGSIASVDDPIVKYVPDLQGTSYDGVTVKQALQMSSGVKFSEAYGTGGADVYDFLRRSMFLNEVPANELMTRYPRAHPPGTKFNYSSGESQILGWLLREATGKHPADYLSEKIWSRVGMEHDASWLLDRNGGMEVTGAGINAALRDYARFGQLMLDDGAVGGEQVLPKGLVKKITVPDSPQVAFGKLYPNEVEGYQYQWWALPDGAYSAEGAYGQFVYVNPAHGVVIAKTGVWPKAFVDANKDENFAAFGAIAAELDASADRSGGAASGG